MYSHHSEDPTHSEEIETEKSFTTLISKIDEIFDTYKKICMKKNQSIESQKNTTEELTFALQSPLEDIRKDIQNQLTYISPSRVSLYCSWQRLLIYLAQWDISSPAHSVFFESLEKTYQSAVRQFHAHEKNQEFLRKV